MTAQSAAAMIDWARALIWSADVCASLADGILDGATSTLQRTAARRVPSIPTSCSATGVAVW